MGTSRALGALLITLVFVGCGGPEPGSREDLSEHLDGVGVPVPMVVKDEHYANEDPVRCGTLVRWYDVIGSPADVHASLVERLEEAGFRVNDESSVALRVMSAATDEHIAFVVFDQEMIAGNTFAPPGTEAEISIRVLDEDFTDCL